jgi:hypothetical protein
VVWVCFGWDGSRISVGLRRMAEEVYLLLTHCTGEMLGRNGSNG